MSRQRIVLTALWLLTLVGLAVRVWRASTISGSYDEEIDSLVYLSQRWLQGGLLYQESYLRQWPIVQLLYAPAAWLASIQAHRILVMGLNLLGGVLLASAVRKFSRAGLIQLGPKSLVPLASGILLVILSQKIPGGIAGSPHQFANTFLVLAVYSLARGLAGARELHGQRGWLVATGAMGMMAVACFFTLIYPLTLVSVLVLVHHRQPGRAAGALAGGAVLATALMFLPYLFVADGASHAWAGAVALPLQWISQQIWREADVGFLFGALIRTPIAGLPLWLIALMPAAGVVLIAQKTWNAPGRRRERLLLVPGLAVVFLLELTWSFQRTDFNGHDGQLVVVPVVLFLASGMAALERSGQPAVRRATFSGTLILSLILFNNMFIAEVFGAPSRLSSRVMALEQDRTMLRTYLAALPAEDRGFTAPQDPALQWQLNVPATTVGIGPDWSLNPQGMKASWATSVIGLPVGVAQTCSQLLQPANAHLVWKRVDPEGPNTEAFIRQCLSQESGRWKEITQDLGLRTGEFKLFRRKENPLSVADPSGLTRSSARQDPR
ncbi:hypothetical protein [Synechococcus sp. 1G10]|uniref:hypothetical protein n=1 Tax=Synechococcus sp. 1G10 TaxID=2025605 RepID=UPI0011808CD1|nr:hypothetical protein [Synechococcus sp. 1G10]